MADDKKPKPDKKPKIKIKQNKMNKKHWHLYGKLLLILVMDFGD